MCRSCAWNVITEYKVISVLPPCKSYVKNQPDQKWRWRVKEPSAGNTEFRGKQFGIPPINFYEMCPIDFFKLFWTYNITQTLVVQSIQRTRAK